MLSQRLLWPGLVSVALGATVGRELLAQSGAAQEPRAVVVVAPVYPEIAHTARVSGVVEVDVEIDGAGATTKAQAMSGNPLLTEPALLSAAQWRFEADASEVRHCRLRFAFRLLDEDTPAVEARTQFVAPHTVETTAVKKKVYANVCGGKSARGESTRR